MQVIMREIGGKGNPNHRQQNDNDNLSQSTNSSYSSIGSSCDLRFRHSILKMNNQSPPSSSTLAALARKSVHFRDEPNLDSDDDDVSSRSATSAGLVEIAYFGTLMQHMEPWADHAFVSGFGELFTAGEIWVKQTSKFPCYSRRVFKILDFNDIPLYTVIKHQTAVTTCAKRLFCPNCQCCRNGFKLNVFNRNGILLASFFRRSHFCAKQLDLVESYYGREETYTGRIERTAQGFTLRDKDHEDIYRILEIPRKRKMFTSSGRKKHSESRWCRSSVKEMRIHRSDNKEVVGRVMYIRRGKIFRNLSCCMSEPLSGFKCNPDVGTNAKILILGTLFFMAHIKTEPFKRLPIGMDAAEVREVLYPQVSFSDSSF